MKIPTVALALLAVSALLVAGGCKRGRAPLSYSVVPPQPKTVEPPPLAPPTAELRVEPSSIERGQKAVLRWSAENAREAWLDPEIGGVETQGEREIQAFSDTTYKLTVWGPGGETSVTARLRVTPAPPPRIDQTREGQRQRFVDVVSNIDDVFFGYDESQIRPDSARQLESNAAALRNLFADIPFGKVRIEGHCDERGTSEYNLALGDGRARAVLEYLTNLGLPAARFELVSYGKEQPQCFESNERCWSRNRRAHFAPAFD